MREGSFYIAFEGTAADAQVLRRVVQRLASEKVSHSNGSMIVDDARKIITDPKWLDLFDAAAIERLTSRCHWQLEDILDCLLHGEYELLEVEYANGQGQLFYYPLAWPFGGTDPIKALVKVCGLRVVRDSFYERHPEEGHSNH
jgi:hypothetical protein